jgi:hypothetical protein
MADVAQWMLSRNTSSPAHEIRSVRETPSFPTYLRGVQVGKELSVSSAEAIPKTETEQTDASSIGMQLYASSAYRRQTVPEVSAGFRANLPRLTMVVPTRRNSTTRLFAGQSSTAGRPCGAVTKCFDEITR